MKNKYSKDDFINKLALEMEKNIEINIKKARERLRREFKKEAN
jgi:hypothetical protein